MTGIVAVATSGGRDSLALLHATLRAAAPLGLRVVALHVHHGLLPEADAWMTGLRDRCARWAGEGWPVEFKGARLQARPGPGESVEAWARRERYAALARMAREAGACLVLLAHHRRDQAETVLLQALRGAGPAGLAAMPAVAEREGLTWARPWLERPVEAIEAYVRAHDLTHVHDPSNDDPRHARSRLRGQVMPALRAAFPDVEQALGGVARRAHEAQEVLEEVALLDLADLDALGEDGSGRLPLARWLRLSAARRSQVLRVWLARQVRTGVPETLVQRVLVEARDLASRRWPLVEGSLLRSWRGVLEVVPARAAPDAGHPGGLRARAGSGVPLRLLRCASQAIPGWSGTLEVFAVAEHGIAPARLAQAVARERRGGDQFARAPNATARSLKKQYQAAAIAPEDRRGPIVVDGRGQVLYVPGLGVDGRAWAPAGRPQWALRWVGEDPGVQARGADASRQEKPSSPTGEPCPEGKP